ncbi:MAG: PIG-L family deacetylase [Bacteroidota bacterium]
MFYRAFFLSCIGLLLGHTLGAQAPARPTSADIYDDIKQLQVLASALYVAAHPDDENTRLISYLSNHLRVNTAYLSLTRGDGGQNLIGPEIRELLGVIRTQELLAARRIDGGRQLFSRANDFGFSKHPDETLRIWQRDEVMADAVWAIRNFQPDIIINRFDHKSAGRTHGHHTASAVLSFEAFDLAADAKAYPEQLSSVSAWQANRLFFNTSWWFYGSRDNFEKADKSNMVSVDIGTYLPLKGKSNNEIASQSRSMHQCQGMGATWVRGSQLEYLEWLKGEKPSDMNDLFAGINTTWSRLEGGAPIGKLLKEVEEEFRFDNPSASIPKLLQAYDLIQKLPDGRWKTIKNEEIHSVIGACMGLFLEAVADDYSSTAGGTVDLKVEVVNRSSIPLTLEKISFAPMAVDTVLQKSLEENERYYVSRQLTIPADHPTTNPYWLNEQADLGMYTVQDQQLRGLPETPRPLKASFVLAVEGRQLSWDKDVVFKRTDPVKGESYRPFEITPPVFVGIAEKVYVFAGEEAQEVELRVSSGKENVEGIVQLTHPDGWRVEPQKAPFQINQKGQEQLLRFKVYPPAAQSEGKLGAVVQVEGQSYNDELVLIEYDHIPTQTVLRPASAKVVRIDLKKRGERIAYIMGAGDDIPASLEQIGYQVDVLAEEDISLDKVRGYDAVILGIRAFNTVKKLKFKTSELLQYVEEGGTMIVQYNTNRRMVTQDFAPYPLKLSRDRVTVEEAEIRMLKPDHPVLNAPNKITAKDFEGWVQERGLYFPNGWDERYEAILSSNDPGEPARDGGLLVASHGKGHYIYTGYSWFRQLPAGVPGAFRLFTNLVSIGKEEGNNQ